MYAKSTERNNVVFEFIGTVVLKHNFTSKKNNFTNSQKQILVPGNDM